MEETRYLLIGGGIASVAAAQAIRKRDTSGRCILVSADHYMPYDRPPLSKDFLTNLNLTEDDAASKFDNFYPDNQIDLRLNTRVTDIHAHTNIAVLQDGSQIRYEKLLLATGSTPRKLGIFHEDLPGIFTLRTIDNAKAIREAMQRAKRCVIAGTGFLGTEVASQCAKSGIETTVLTSGAHIWDRFASPALGKFMDDYYEGQGVKLLANQRIGTFEEGFTVLTQSDYRLPADFVVLALGVTLNLDLASKAELEPIREEGVKVNECLQTMESDIYAAGDIALFPDVAMDRRHHLEHHLNARWQGETAGANMAGDETVYDRVPYFFSDFFDLHMILRGWHPKAEMTTVLGSFESAEFIELYGDAGGFLRMGIAISRDESKLDPLSDKLEELIRKRVKIESVSMSDFAVASASA